MIYVSVGTSPMAGASPMLQGKGRTKFVEETAGQYGEVLVTFTKCKGG